MSFKKNLLERIAAYIPGYAGYKQKEVRRETDALLRRHVASILSSVASRLVLSPSDARAVAANPDARFLWDAVRAELDKVAQKIDKAPHGYAGFFDLAKVDEGVLEEVYRHDLSLVEEAKKVADLAAALQSLKPGSPEWIDSLRNLLAQLQSLDAKIDERTKTLKAIAEPPPSVWEQGHAAAQQTEVKKEGIFDKLFKRWRSQS
ncbi:MAG: hypothetical protein OWQ51_00945 [Pyrobaculum arsenaticum]|uniref:Uncharacterized protein n=2 Tax=Pyrobaculum arsenaticum TaxID=121277 RepID=A4WJP8_PYRAR|nr:hypothetical protein [Pyrobaculum arsenaticum]ABP50615.1 conserved hypothetical protein [Pyrobaculum arsenaticum DSM 13514]MCY0889540.1 hypothetical protein [Pyrobaculum arsenaticum]NYR14454.1 hypothetical protein [Pyrobaculum arsenaticum]